MSFFIINSNKMGGGSSTHNDYVNNQEKYVSKEFQNAKRSLPQRGYNDSQIKGKLRQEYASKKNGGYYNEKNAWINDKIWENARRY